MTTQKEKGMSTVEIHESNAALIRRRRRRGVTLVEVLIVVAILALIAGGVAIFAIPQFQKAQKEQAKLDTQTLSGAIDLWRVNASAPVDDCPTVEKLRADKAIKPEQKTDDPWGRPYKIVKNAETGACIVMSSGPDGKEGNEDDITPATKIK